MQGCSRDAARIAETRTRIQGRHNRSTMTASWCCWLQFHTASASLPWPTTITPTAWKSGRTWLAKLWSVHRYQPLVRTNYHLLHLHLHPLLPPPLPPPLSHHHHRRRRHHLHHHANRLPTDRTHHFLLRIPAHHVRSVLLSAASVFFLFLLLVECPKRHPAPRRRRLSKNEPPFHDRSANWSLASWFPARWLRARRCTPTWAWTLSSSIAPHYKVQYASHISFHNLYPTCRPAAVIYPVP